MEYQGRLLKKRFKMDVLNTSKSFSWHHRTNKHGYFLLPAPIAIGVIPRCVTSRKLSGYRYKKISNVHFVWL
jgi:hypothetical protein